MPFPQTAGFDVNVIPQVAFANPALFGQTGSAISRGALEGFQLAQEPARTRLLKAEAGKASLPFPVVTSTKPVQVRRDTGEVVTPDTELPAGTPVDTLSQESGFTYNPVTQEQTPFTHFGEKPIMTAEQAEEAASHAQYFRQAGAGAEARGTAAVTKGNRITIQTPQGPMQVQLQMDENGNPVTDEEGNPLYTPLGIDPKAQAALDRAHALANNANLYFHAGQTADGRLAVIAVDKRTGQMVDTIESSLLASDPTLDKMIARKMMAGGTVGNTTIPAPAPATMPQIAPPPPPVAMPTITPGEGYPGAANAAALFRGAISALNPNITLPGLTPPPAATSAPTAASKDFLGPTTIKGEPAVEAAIYTDKDGNKIMYLGGGIWRPVK